MLFLSQSLVLLIISDITWGAESLSHRGAGTVVLLLWTAEF